MEVTNCTSCGILVYEVNIPSKRSGRCWHCEIANLRSQLRNEKSEERDESKALGREDDLHPTPTIPPRPNMERKE